MSSAAVERAVRQEKVPALRFVDRDFHELSIFGVRGGALRHQQRSPKAVLDIASNIVANRLFVETLEIGGEAGKDDVAGTLPFCERALLRFSTLVFQHDLLLR